DQRSRRTTLYRTGRRRDHRASRGELKEVCVSSLCNLSVLCASVVNITTETQRTQRLHREVEGVRVMTSAGKLMTKAIAVIVIVAMLDAVGVPPMIMVLFTGMCFVIWLFARRAQTREVERIFDFYIAADAVLREEERRWY